LYEVYKNLYETVNMFGGNGQGNGQGNGDIINEQGNLSS
jgi:hypothetical protein